MFNLSLPTTHDLQDHERSLTNCCKRLGFLNSVVTQIPFWPGTSLISPHNDRRGAQLKASDLHMALIALPFWTWWDYALLPPTPASVASFLHLPQVRMYFPFFPYNPCPTADPIFLPPNHITSENLPSCPIAYSVVESYCLNPLPSALNSATVPITDLLRLSARFRAGPTNKASLNYHILFSETSSDGVATTSCFQ